MDPTMALPLLAGVLGKGGGGNSSAQSTATNTTGIDFSPTLNSGIGPVAPVNSGSASPNVSTPLSNTQTDTASSGTPLSSLYGTPLSSPLLNPLTGAIPVARQGITGSLSSSTILLLGGLALIMVVALTGHKRH